MDDDVAITSEAEGGRTSLTAQQFRAAIADGASHNKRVFQKLAVREADLQSLELADGSFTFQDCDFSGSNMSKAVLAGSPFEQCLFQQTNLNGANLIGTRFSGCNLGSARMREAEAAEAGFPGTDMREVDATAANFQGADFTGASLRDARLGLADVRYAKNLRLDHTMFRGAIALHGGTDPWSELHQKYTGLNLVLNLIPVSFFLMKHATKAFGFYLLAVMEGTRIGQAALIKHCKTNPQGCESWSTWQILLGVPDGYLAVAFVLFALIYNFARFLLTWQVSQLRAHEESTGYSPPFANAGDGWRNLWGLMTSYSPLHRLHRILWWMQVLMYLLFGLNLWRLAFTPIMLPR